MPFLPTLATVVVLAVASVFCSGGQTPAPGAAARMIPASGEASLAMAEPALPTPEPAPRPPAVVAFSEIYPLVALPADPATTSALPAHATATAPALAGRTPRRLAVTGRRPCPGRRCQDDPFAPARQGSEPATAEAAAPPALPSALPFAETVAEAVGARMNQITGTAGDLMRGGQTMVKGSVTVLADRLL